MRRRGLLGLLGGALVAPALVRSGLLMPVKVQPPSSLYYAVDWANRDDITGYRIYQGVRFTEARLCEGPIRGLISGSFRFDVRPMEIPPARVLADHRLVAEISVAEYRRLFEAGGQERPAEPPPPERPKSHIWAGRPFHRGGSPWA